MLNCFLLTAQALDIRGSCSLVFFSATDAHVTLKATVADFRPMFFISRSTPAQTTAGCHERRQLPLRTMRGEPVDCVYFPTAGAMRTSARRLRGQHVRVFESDIHPCDRYLMERFIKCGFIVEADPNPGNLLSLHNPRMIPSDTAVPLTTLSFDIETNARTGELYSIACAGKTGAVFMIGTGVSGDQLVYCPDERALISQFADHVRKQNPDLLIGWNGIDFDLTVLEKRSRAWGISLELGREPGTRILLPEQTRRGQTSVYIPGRVMIDVPTALRVNSYTFEEYSLEFVARQVVGAGKQISAEGTDKITEIDRLFEHDKEALAAYNLKDAELTLQVFEATHLLPNMVQRSLRSGLLLDLQGSSAAFDFLYLPKLHRAGYVAVDVADVVVTGDPLPGGYVLESKPGIYRDVLLFDFKSLYPSIIRTFHVDPLALVAPSENRVQGPAGPSFARDISILPGIIAELLEARAQARRDKNKPLTQAIKILMNSFYGVLGSPGCRFYSEKLAGTITGIGQRILRRTVDHVEAHYGLTVLYGDTDSIFVLSTPGTGAEIAARAQTIAAEINSWLLQWIRDEHDCESFLELEFETHFVDFFLPTMRGSTLGSKKRYCGSVLSNNTLELVFKGMESARTDWTELAREFQHTLYGMVFRKKPVREYITETVRRVRAGLCDSQLVYRKRVRKPLDQYDDPAPPHIRAARMLDYPVSRIAYVITTSGPQPLSLRTAPLDHDHYVDAQLKPIADAILEWIDLDFDSIVSGQMDLFAGQE